MYPRTIIDSLPAVPNRDQLTHKDLHAHFSTGQSILLSGSGRDKKYGYRNGIQTDLGDIRNDVWRDLVRELIVRSHEEDLFDKLLEWEKEHTYWLKTKAELSITRLSSTLQGSLTTRNGLTMKLLPSTMATSRSPMRGKQLNASDIHENGNATLWHCRFLIAFFQFTVY